METKKPKLIFVIRGYGTYDIGLNEDATKESLIEGFYDTANTFSKARYELTDGRTIILNEELLKRTLVIIE